MILINDLPIKVFFIITFCIITFCNLLISTGSTGQQHVPIVILDIIFIFRTPCRHGPKIGGKEIDLYLLYSLVTSNGGWVKVSFNLLNYLYTYLSFPLISFLTKY